MVALCYFGNLCTFAPKAGWELGHVRHAEATDLVRTEWHANATADSSDWSPGHR